MGGKPSLSRPSLPRPPPAWRSSLPGTVWAPAPTRASDRRFLHEEQFSCRFREATSVTLHPILNDCQTAGGVTAVLRAHHIWVLGRLSPPVPGLVASGDLVPHPSRSLRLSRSQQSCFWECKHTSRSQAACPGCKAAVGDPLPCSDGTREGDVLALQLQHWQQVVQGSLGVSG
ncbi:hypothetical protein MC885_000764 [Smutsia gigantea]|nr:hypothetical protein MC885_000764 [Smutsia gigantea]